MKLQERQFMFSELLVMLYLRAKQMGYKVIIGEVFRSPEETKRLAALGVGHPKSLHGLCLAAHLELFRGGRYLVDSEQYKEIGEWWENQHPLCRWGGRFDKPDGHHFSISYDGRA